MRNPRSCDPRNASCATGRRQRVRLRGRGTYVLLEGLGVEDEDLIVEGLHREPFARRVLAHGRHRVHRRFCDVLDHDGDVVVPDSHRLVVRRRHEATVLIHKVDRVDLRRVSAARTRDEEKDVPGRDAGRTPARSRRIRYRTANPSQLRSGAEVTGLTCTIFLSDMPARKIFGFSGWNLMQYGILPFEKACRH